MATKIRFASFIIVSSVLWACGGGQSGAESPDSEAEATASDDATSDEGAAPEEGGEAATEQPSDGIVRDADGDGVPDDQQAGGCEGKNETQCKINSKCAWSDQGKCVDAGSM